ncbi:MAG: hypothetical protein HY681_14595 [Chloroflexi bacterium]|nr:hypothetical protein [Chloroflexota bacterium]
MTIVRMSSEFRDLFWGATRATIRHTPRQIKVKLAGKECLVDSWDYLAYLFESALVDILNFTESSPSHGGGPWLGNACEQLRTVIGQVGQRAAPQPSIAGDSPSIQVPSDMLETITWALDVSGEVVKRNIAVPTRVKMGFRDVLYHLVIAAGSDVGIADRHSAIAVEHAYVSGFEYLEIVARHNLQEYGSVRHPSLLSNPWRRWIGLMYGKKEDSDMVQVEVWDALAPARELKGQPEQRLAASLLGQAIELSDQLFKRTENARVRAWIIAGVFIGIIGVLVSVIAILMTFSVDPSSQL